MGKLYGYTIMAMIMAILTSADASSGATRGIRVVSKQGQTLNLYRDYHALVVGISDYEKWPKLPNAVNDAKEVAGKLKKIGFEVRLVLDPTSQEMKTVLNEMVYHLGNKKNRALLFYFAGHGETETMADNTKLGYIIPRDCPLLKKDPMGFAARAVSMREIESVSLRIRAKHVIMLFDSCFSGSLFSLIRAVPEDISEKSALPVRQYITAGREDERVPDKSMFKRCFLIGLDGDADLTGDGYITGSELGMYLSDKVVNYTRRRQHPQYGKINNPDLDRGDFIFVPKGSDEKVQIASLDEKKQKRETREEVKKETIVEERVAKKTFPRATPIDKVVIGVLDIEYVYKFGSPKEKKKALMKELRRNTRIKLVDIPETNSLSDLKRLEYKLAEEYKRNYQLDMILHTYREAVLHLGPSATGSDYYFSLIDLYSKKVKEVYVETQNIVSISRRYKGVSTKLLVNEDLDRVLRAKKEALGK